MGQQAVHHHSGSPSVPLLQHSRGPWTSASATAAELHTSTANGRNTLRPAHDPLTAWVGLTAPAALLTVLTSWEERLAAIRDECDHLSGALRQVAVHLGEVDTATGTSLKAVPVPTSAGTATR
ncbi:hypothetical protein [Streptomyces lichenis]|uniref:Uncharacterized protein n=1 Tax=Streptomyces lichenis TaxID=2306967 RepID=A0ABT0IDQ3_9ACTN|nr:hypothetical protein [Streptomyces lichenis]MCK8679458.1 hypothetical protein [Streptomyces lichenis]